MAVFVYTDEDDGFSLSQPIVSEPKLSAANGVTDKGRAALKDSRSSDLSPHVIASQDELTAASISFRPSVELFASPDSQTDLRQSRQRDEFVSVSLESETSSHAAVIENGIYSTAVLVEHDENDNAAADFESNSIELSEENDRMGERSERASESDETGPTDVDTFSEMPPAETGDVSRSNAAIAIEPIDSAIEPIADVTVSESASLSAALLEDVQGSEDLDALSQRSEPGSGRDLLNDLSDDADGNQVIDGGIAAIRYSSMCMLLFSR